MAEDSFDQVNRNVGDEQYGGRSIASVAEYYNRTAETWDELYGIGRQNSRFARQMRENIEGSFQVYPTARLRWNWAPGRAPTSR